MDWLLKLLFILTYTDAPTAEGEFAPSLLLRAIGGWDDIEAVEDTHLLPRERQPAGPDPALGKLREAKAAAPDDDDEEVGRLRRVPIDEDDLAHGLTYDPAWLLALVFEEEPSEWDEFMAALRRCGQQAVASIAFQPNRTVRLAAIMAEHAIAQTGLSYPQRRKAAPPAALSGERAWTAYLHPNGAAEYLLSSVVMPLLKALDRADFLTANREAVRALWGVRRYDQLHGRLPESLPDLVPEILASVPRDPYDGGNVKYSDEKRRIWVLGEDMIDDGGMEDDRYGFRSSWPGLDEERFPYDPTLFFGWLEGGEREKP